MVRYLMFVMREENCICYALKKILTILDLNLKIYTLKRMFWALKGMFVRDF